MNKIPTIFVRDWAGELGPPGRLVTREPNPEAAWVFAGEGVATQKLDGTACLIRGSVLYKRLAVPANKDWPEWFEFVEHEPGQDGRPGKDIGWIPVGEGPEDRWHREAFAHRSFGLEGTYELLGPKVQGDPEGVGEHVLIAHAGAHSFPDCPRSYQELKAWLSGRPIEGVVWHHEDGRMAKIKLKDFGLSR